MFFFLRCGLTVYTNLSVFSIFMLKRQCAQRKMHGAYSRVRKILFFRLVAFSPPPQIVQHRSTEYTYGRMTTAFSFPLLVSYLPLSTTIGEFREIIAVALRRFVLPRDAARKVCT